MIYTCTYVRAQEAVKREVKEEAGLDFEPNALVQVESYEKMSWIRFTFSGKFSICVRTNLQ